MKIEDYCIRQKKELAIAFNKPSHYPIGIIDSNKFPQFLKSKHSIEIDLRVKNNKAFIRNILGTDQSEYWVHVDYTGYRKAYFRHLKEKYGVCSTDLTSDWHADHMLSRAFARKYGVKYVRMCLLQKKQNMSYGRKFEKNMLKQSHNKRFIFLIDFLCALKVLNVKIPSSKIEYEKRKSEISKTLIDEGVIFFDSRGGEHSLDEYFDWWSIV